MNKTGFLESSPGNRSNSRLIADVVIVAALIFTGILISVGSKVDEPNIMLIATSAGTLFVTIAGPALAFLFAQKSKEKPITNGNDAPTDPVA